MTGSLNSIQWNMMNRKLTWQSQTMHMTMSSSWSMQGSALRRSSESGKLQAKTMPRTETVSTTWLPISPRWGLKLQFRRCSQRMSSSVRKIVCTTSTIQHSKHVNWHWKRSWTSYKLLWIWSWLTRRLPSSIRSSHRQSNTSWNCSGRSEATSSNRQKRGQWRANELQLH